jgi:hypothetical protein
MQRAHLTGQQVVLWTDVELEYQKRRGEERRGGRTRPRRSCSVHGRLRLCYDP